MQYKYDIIEATSLQDGMIKLKDHGIQGWRLVTIIERAGWYYFFLELAVEL